MESTPTEDKNDSKGTHGNVNGEIMKSSANIRESIYSKPPINKVYNQDQNSSMINDKCNRACNREIQE